MANKIRRNDGGYECPACGYIWAERVPCCPDCGELIEDGGDDD